MRKNSSSSVAVRGTSAAIPTPASASASVSSVTASSAAVNESPRSPSAQRLDARPPVGDLERPRVVGGAQLVAAGGGGDQLAERALVDHAAGAHDRDAVAQLLDLAHQVRGEQHGDALVGEPPHERAHVAHAGRVEAGGRLVEQQQPRVAQQRPGDPEPLAHAVRVAADPVLRAVGEVDGVERRADARARRRRRRAPPPARGSCARSGTGRSAAPRRTRRRRPARAPPPGGGRARTASRCPRRAGSARAASAARSSCRRRSARGSRRRRRR